MILIYIYELCSSLFLMFKIKVTTEKLKLWNVRINMVLIYCLLFLTFNLINYIIKDKWPLINNFSIIRLIIIILGLSIIILKLSAIAHILTAIDLEKSQQKANKILYLI